jgi:hypothetical protein
VSEPDDSYHSTWFAGVAADFERAVHQTVSGRVESAAATENLAEARAALTLTLGAQESNRHSRGQVKIV